MSEKYNGWTNYETWAANLWIDEGRNYYVERAGEVYAESKADKPFTREERAALDLADILKDEHEEAAQDMLESAKATASLFADILNAGLKEINWYEIAQHLVEEATESN